MQVGFLYFQGMLRGVFPLMFTFLEEIIVDMFPCTWHVEAVVLMTECVSEGKK